MSSESKHIRNFSIIAHIDHGKSTLADRMLEITGTIEKRKMRNQALDQMDLERERGITIKLQPVRMEYSGFILNLIDTPGHVDFTYEVSRALAAVEGAILLVDATQGIHAQTIANLHLAQKEGLTIIPAVNKVDIPSADRALAVSELATLLAVPQEEILMVSGKTGEGVQELLRRVVEKTPPPEAPPDDKLRALIFDSQFDAYKGVIAYVRIVSSAIKKGEKIHMLRTKKSSEVLEVGCFAPERKETAELAAGDRKSVV